MDDEYLARHIRAQIRDAFIDKVVEDITSRYQPLADDLSELLGESPEAWRGLVMFATGMMNIAAELLDDGTPPADVLREVMGLTTTVMLQPKAASAISKFLDPS